MAIYLNLGSGRRPREGYINIDAVKHTEETIVGDVLNLKFANDSVDKIFSEHVIEHFDRKDLERFFDECHSMLKPGGEIEFIAPCIKTWIQRYINGEIDMIHLDLFLYGPQLHPYDFHRIGIFNEMLYPLCDRHGFQIIDLQYQDRPHSTWEVYMRAIKK